jgi:hypothetical protein
METTKNHLHFGQAFHSALEHLYLNGMTKEVAEDAALIFTKEYREQFNKETDSLFEPKTPLRAAEALLMYVQQYPAEERLYEVIKTETAARVPVSDSRVITCRLDTILRNKKTGQVFVLEHKTGSRNTSQWQMQWLLSTQIGAYTHVLYSLFPIDEVFGVIVNAIFFLKKETQFYRLDVPRTKDQMNVWLTNVNSWIDDIEFETENMLNTSEDDPVMSAFPLNPTACTRYFGCPYHAYCLAWPNPLRRCDEPPVGMKIEWWDPTEYEATNKVDLTKEQKLDQ